IYLIFSLLGYYIHTEVKSAVGRADAVCVTDEAVYVFEFKVDSSAEAALRQIDDRGYMIPFRNETGKKLVKVGVNISSSTRSLDDWLVEYGA
ncbi:MAG TPA: AAA family ATPase, partial [Rikenellaceae bacterium]|nr:AAA family ATPase [Rikenellaceae bacterium]